MSAQEAERARISRELHDEIGQTLAAVKLNLQAIGRLSTDRRIASQVRDGVAVVDATVVEVRNLSRDLRPSVLDDLGLTAALQWYLERSADRAGLAVVFTPQPDLPRAPREVETACYRIVQEAMTNVLRHRASRVEARWRGPPRAQRPRRRLGSIGGTPDRRQPPTRAGGATRRTRHPDPFGRADHRGPVRGTRTGGPASERGMP
jgi:signal transduction histidine kinase